MANARFVYTNLFWNTGAVLSNTVGGWLTTRPLSFALSAWRKKVARSTTTNGDQDVVIDLGSAQSFNCAFVVNPKIHTGGSMVLQANATNAWGSPSFVSSVFPAMDPLRKLTGLYFSNQSFRYIRLKFTNTAAASEFVEFGVLYLGMYYEPTYNITDDLSIVTHDPSRVVQAYDGERQSHRLTKFQEIVGHLQAMPASDKDTFLSMYYLNGKDTPLMFTVDSAVLAQTYFGFLSDQVNTDYNSGSVDLWDIDVNFQEAR